MGGFFPSSFLSGLVHNAFQCKLEEFSRGRIASVPNRQEAYCKFPEFLGPP